MDACRARFATLLGTVFFIGMMLAMGLTAVTVTGRAEAQPVTMAML